MNNIKGFEEKTFMLRMDGSEGAKLFADESLDFVYIDANHTYESVKQDIDDLRKREINLQDESLKKENEYGVNLARERQELEKVKREISKYKNECSTCKT